MAIAKTDLVAAFGAYYLNSGQNLQRLKEEIRTPSVTASYATPLIVDSEVYQFSITRFQKIVQQFQKSFTPKGDLTFVPNEIRLRNIKIDISLYPDDVKASWAGFLGSLTDQDRKNWPIVRYMLEKHIAPQLKQDMELDVYFKGVYEAPVNGTAGEPSKVMDGVKTLLDFGLTTNDENKKMHAVALSQVPAANNSFDMLEEFSDNIEDKLAGTPMTIYCSPQRARAYLRDKRNTHGNDINYNASKVTIDFDENKKIVGLPSMIGSPYIWATPDFNFLSLRRTNGQSDPKVEEAKREVALMLDWWEGLGFGTNQLVYVYKPAV